ncbi:hypothetical protein IWX78_000844 [Mycetocola sp. CAN_C7]|uniref:hypothetical protein n=1 Tax=Mycetocola sp. CAN_C7 TaxID=2787724 RepID=UPI001A338946
MTTDAGRPTVFAVVAGRVLAVAFRILQRFRRPRPIHPHGVALSGTVRYLTSPARSGIAFLDHPAAAELPVSARVSRSLGVPAPLPDVIGLAIRWDGPSGPADLALASTGFGVPSRFWLAAHRSPSRARFTTLIPYRSDRGPVLLAARTIGPRDLPSEPRALATALTGTTWRLRLYHASPTGHWHPFAIVELRHSSTTVDTPDRFDPVRHQLPGSETYNWARRLREPSYARVQGKTS